MAGIFISYRREDSGAYAGRLYDALVRHFGPDRIFFDIDTIGPGEDYREVIDRTCSACEVLIAVIGKQWATASDRTGKLRLESKRDTLRMEIASALQKGLKVIPVLVGGAEMPGEDALPEDLRPLVYRNAWELSDKRFHQDVQLLVYALKKVSSGKAEEEVAGGQAELEAKRKADEEAARRQAELEGKLKADEEATRRQAELEAKLKADEEAARKQAELEAKRKADEEAARKQAELEARRKAHEENARRQAALEAKLKADEETARKRGELEGKSLYIFLVVVGFVVSVLVIFAFVH